MFVPHYYNYMGVATYSTIAKGVFTKLTAVRNSRKYRSRKKTAIQYRASYSSRQCLTTPSSGQKVVLCTHFCLPLPLSAPRHSSATAPLHLPTPPSLTSSHGHRVGGRGLCQMRSPHRSPATHPPSLTKSPAQVSSSTHIYTQPLCMYHYYPLLNTQWIELEQTETHLDQQVYTLCHFYLTLIISGHLIHLTV